MAKKRKFVFIAVVFLTIVVVWYRHKTGESEVQSSIGPETASMESSPQVQKPVEQQNPSLLSHKPNRLSVLVSRAKKYASASRKIRDKANDFSEDELISNEDNIPEQQVWRGDLINEAQDDEWTRLMREELTNKADTLLVGKVDIRHLSCRETVCRMYLQFEDMLDAEAFTMTQNAPDLHYEYQHLNPNAGNDSRQNYELLVKRERPDHRDPTPKVAGRLIPLGT